VFQGVITEAKATYTTPLALQIGEKLFINTRKRDGALKVDPELFLDSFEDEIEGIAAIIRYL
jgi:hypothetical protein